MQQVSSDPMKAKYCRERAAECAALAESSERSITRELMLYSAVRWEAFADEHEGKQPTAPSEGWTPPT